jgi:hypothetical protein
MVIDPAVIARLRAERAGAGDWARDEVWDGVPVMPPLPNDEHQEIQFNLLFPLAAAVTEPGVGRVRAGVNVSDRDDGWDHNFRGPDAVVYLDTNPAVNHGTHWTGGPDVLAEIISPGEDPYAKFDFYAKVRTREVLIIDRYPWAVELHHLRGSRLALAGRSDLATPAVLTSSVLPLTFQLQPGTPRPTIAVTHTGTGQAWAV